MTYACDSSYLQGLRFNSNPAQKVQDIEPLHFTPFQKNGMRDHLHAGIHQPRSGGEIQTWLRIDGDCRDYLDWLRRGYGFWKPGQGSR